MPKYQLNLEVSKEDMLILNDLAGEGVSIREYMSEVIHEHVAAQQSFAADGAFTLRCPKCEAYQGWIPSNFFDAGPWTCSVCRVRYERKSGFLQVCPA